MKDSGELKKILLEIEIDGVVHKLIPFEQMQAKHLRSKKYREAYYKEIARLELAREIRHARIAKKLTQKAVAAKAHMPQSVIARAESGTHSISFDTLSRIAQALGKKIQLV